MVTTEQIEKIKEQFIEVIRYSQNIENPLVDELFEIWYEKKKKIIHALGDELIKTLIPSVTFELSEKEKERKFDIFIELLIDRWDCSENFISYIKAQGSEALFSNTTLLNWSLSDDKTIKKGTKLLKTFKYFVNNDRLLTDIQNEASRIIQLNKIEGELCASVHPLDFLSSSENNHQWRSCHALDGEYRSGNLSYMLDDTTLICYLKSKEDAKLPHFPYTVPWNSKKWRVLLFLSNDWTMAFAGRPYPFETKVGIDIIKSEVLPLFTSSEQMERWSSWNNLILTELSLTDETFYLSEGGYIPIGTNSLIKLTDLIKDAKNATHYNDLLCSTCYSPIYSYKKTTDLWFEHRMSDRKTTRFKIGSQVNCLHCGKSYVDCCDAMTCQSCHDKFYDETPLYYCDCCGASIIEDECWWCQDVPLCKSCYNTETRECEECHTVHFSDNISFSEFSNKYLCSYCLNEENYDREKGEE